MEIKTENLPITKPGPKRQSLDAAAELILRALGDLDAGWKDRDEACAAEFGLSPAQRLLKYAAITLDQGLHLNMLSGYDFVETGMPRPDGELMSPMKGKCPCGKEFHRAAPGQICCSNECGFKYYPPAQPKIPEYGDIFEDQAIAALEGLDDLNPRNVSIPTAGSLR